MMRVPFVDLRAQYESIKKEMDDTVLRVIHDCDFILGKDVARFEHNFAKFLETEHVIGVGNGLDALKLSLEALGVGKEDEVMIPANTYIATALAISAVQGRPVLVDVEAGSYNMDPEQIEKAITPRTRAILPVHLFGQPCEIDVIMEIARRRGLHTVEDACQAHGARYQGKCAGTFAEAGCFSFYPSKNLGCLGDGGAIVTSNAELAEKLRRLRNYGQREKYHHLEKGVNSRLDNLQAAVLNVKLPYLNMWNRLRVQHARRYNLLLAGVGDVITPEMSPNRDHVFHLYVIRTQQRDRLQKFLAERDIATQIHYPVPIHLQDAYSDLGYSKDDFPVTEKAATEMLSLPMYSELTEEQIEYVAHSISRFYS